ncbi:2OG-Fe(II) oxygenase [Qipengyuania qiaonensis]|uniref:2OG-Fe(II) oxygenase n=1 Tax=Qipengyuania qiaonensis TaxID=2867240 RepID=A0ABS7JAP9_9SPHN|nr:2OG-Fe(II) oxygenase [Qipengyuania qiaonensis]MBX7484023.1 2OG-Fe(II) oxygenase [Qipengyuania qiaonensis]
MDSFDNRPLSDEATPRPAAPHRELGTGDNGSILSPDQLGELSERGLTVACGLFNERECLALGSAYAETPLYRSTIDMRRHGFGEGQYRYFRYPLPGFLQRHREQLYRSLVPVANEWRAIRGLTSLPAEHADYIRCCHEAGQVRPTPLILRYGPGDYNRLHQDIYGEHVFPIQAVVMLSRPGEEFTGGELVLVEQKPRSQSRAKVVPLRTGDAALFAVNEFPARGSRGHYHLKMRHGVSEVLNGERLTLGIIFHDAR